MASIVLSVDGCIDYQAYRAIITCATFLLKKKVTFFFPPEKPQMSAGGWCRKKRDAFLARASTLYSFLFEDIALIERELGPTDEEVPKKGKRLQ